MNSQRPKPAVVMNRVAADVAICNALGLDPSAVMTIDIHIGRDGVFFTVKYPLGTELIRKIADVVSLYENYEPSAPT